MTENQGIATLTELDASSERFFELHWNAEHGGACPSWNLPWFFLGTLHGNSSQGVYALLDKNCTVLYIGVGASYGRALYAGHGLGSRISAYRRVSPGQAGVPIKERKYEPTALWAQRGLTSIATLELPAKCAYLAYALEAWLLHHCPTPHNRIRPTSGHS